MVYVLVNEKGGVGKSFLSGHLIPEFIRSKGIQDSVRLYEFDEYSRTSENYLQKSEFVISKVISKKDIDTEIFDVRYDSNIEDVIVDIGAGDVLGDFIKEVEVGIGLDKLVFVIPYTDDSLLALDNTINTIKKYIENPRVMVVLNRVGSDIYSIKEAKPLIVELYGSEMYAIPPSPLLKKIDKYIKAAIPDVTMVKKFAAMEQKSMADIKSRYMQLKELSDEELFSIWKARGMIKGDSPTREEYKNNYALMLRDSKVFDFLRNCSEFFEELSNISKV